MVCVGLIVHFISWLICLSRGAGNLGNPYRVDTQAVSTQATVTCQPYFGTGSSTSVYCSFSVCGSNAIVASNAPGSGGSCTGDTYLYLYLYTATSSTLLVENDDSAGSLCSSLAYTQTTTSCVTYRLKQSCFGSVACSGTTVVTYTPLVSSFFVCNFVLQVKNFYPF